MPDTEGTDHAAVHRDILLQGAAGAHADDAQRAYASPLGASCARSMFTKASSSFTTMSMLSVPMPVLSAVMCVPL